MRAYINAAKAVLIWWCDGAKPIDPWSRCGKPSSPKYNPSAFRNVGRGGKFTKWETAKILWSTYVSVGSNRCFDIGSAVHREIESRAKGMWK